MTKVYLNMAILQNKNGISTILGYKYNSPAFYKRKIKAKKARLSGSKRLRTTVSSDSCFSAGVVVGQGIAPIERKRLLLYTSILRHKRFWHFLLGRHGTRRPAAVRPGRGEALVVIPCRMACFSMYHSH